MESAFSHLRTPCPFCSMELKRHGNHLPFCFQRDGRDYTNYLFLKTLSKRANWKKKHCPHCGKCFKRLDTHMRVSAMCRHVPSNATTISEPPTLLSVAASHPGSSTEEIQNFHTSTHQLETTSLTSGPNSCQKNLRKLKEERNRTRNELRRAKRHGMSAESIRVLDTKIHQLLRQHRQIRRAQDKTSAANEANKERRECARDLNRFAKKVLDGDENTCGTEPTFGADTANNYFRTVYHADHSFPATSLATRCSITPSPF